MLIAGQRRGMGGADGSKKGSRGRTTTLADRAAAQHLSALGGRSPHPSQPQQNASLAAAKSEQVVYPPTEATIATMEATGTESVHAFFCKIQ